MAIQTDVKANSLAASGTVYGARTRVRGVIIEPGASAGSVVLKNGGSSGTTVLTINTTAGGETFNALIPSSGVLFTTDVYATLTNAKVTVFYG
ncbi:hypothetical protein EBT31_00575 [bacterium]|nr:hypothetical protein [bacterium]NBX48767.1 hypothetical protein [bacterium]